MRGAASPEAMRHRSAVTIANVATPSAPTIARDRRVVNRHGWFARTIPASSRRFPVKTRCVSATPSSESGPPSSLTGTITRR